MPQPREAIRSIRARTAVAPYQMVSSNSARNPVFDLTMAHLHRLIAPHIITKFPA
jgi:hypothetical protein